MEKDKFSSRIKYKRKVELENFKPIMLYSEEDDIFNLFFRGNEKVKATVEAGEFLRFDIDKHGCVVGVEIENFSELLEKSKNKLDFFREENETGK